MSQDPIGPTRRRHHGRAVTKKVRIDAPPQAIWEAWAKPQEIARWFVDRAEGEMAEGATVTWIFERFGYRLPIEVYDSVPGEYLAFGGELPGRPPALQEVLIRREGGTTVLRLVNSGFLEGADWDEELEGVDSGWSQALAVLKLYLERYRGRDRAHHLALRPAGAFPYEKVVPLYTTRAGLESWLADSAHLASEPLAVGGAVRLDFGDGLALDGEVLARSAWELLLSWPELDGVLGLKAFRFGGDRAVALALSAWPPPGPLAKDWQVTEGIMERATGRLAERLSDGAREDGQSSVGG
ncbi:MAG TPA: SRPBCC domain-containing protein [Thermoanaerobaculia bacterium]|nr:SRPBCC domain-containing protein [Thermoanaerobaculia bacterium]